MLNGGGVPQAFADFTQHDFVGYDSNTDIIEGFNALGAVVDRDFFKTRCGDNIAYWELVRAGCGIGFAQAEIGRSDPAVAEIDIGIPLPVLSIWLTTHEAMRQTPRIRRVWTLLEEGLRPLVS